MTVRSSSDYHTNKRLENLHLLLILNTGNQDRVTLQNWYSSPSNQSVVNLQVIVEAMAEFDASSADPKLEERSMAEAKEQDEKQKTVGLNIKLAPVDNSDQPVLANFTRLNGAPGMVFVDFGFLEPAALSALSRLARSGGKIPETLSGKLAVRVALGYDTLAALHQQLGQVVARLKAQQPAAKTAPAKKDTKH